MKSTKRLTWASLSIATALALTACGHKAEPRFLDLSVADTTETPDAPRPQFGQLRAVAPGSPEEAERNYLRELVIDPLMKFSVGQEATIAGERQRAGGLVAKIQAANEAFAKRKLTLR